MERRICIGVFLCGGGGEVHRVSVVVLFVKDHVVAKTMDVARGKITNLFLALAIDEKAGSGKTASITHYTSDTHSSWSEVKMTRRADTSP